MKEFVKLWEEYINYMFKDKNYKLEKGFHPNKMKFSEAWYCYQFYKWLVKQKLIKR